MRRETKAVIGIGVVLGAVIAITVVLDALVPSPGGPRSSSFATAPDGVAAWADLARRSGLEVRTLRERWSDDTAPSEGTVVLLDPDELTRGQARALRRFAEGGGRVVAGGSAPGPWIDELAGGLEWREGGDETARVLVPAPETGAASALRTAAVGHWERAGNALPVAAGGDGAIVLVRAAGQGRIALVADPSPLQNRLLDDADNAALALGLAGRGPVTFVESVHGYGTATGLAALPARFGWALILLALSGLLLIAARWRRLGPPEPPEEPLFPPRRAYVDALAATVARSRDRSAAVESVREAARERLERTADDEAQALLELEDDIAAGRALARLSGEGRRA